MDTQHLVIGDLEGLTKEAAEVGCQVGYSIEDENEVEIIGLRATIERFRDLWADDVGVGRSSSMIGASAWPP